MNNIRRSYDAEFKRNAVMLADEPGRTVSDVAESLGVRADLIYRWRRELRNQNHLAFPGKGNQGLNPLVAIQLALEGKIPGLKDGGGE